MITIKNAIFEVQGSSKKDKVYGITLSGKEDVILKDCVFANQGYASILNHSEGKVIVEDCKFDCKAVYNPIEGSQTIDNGDVIVKGCTFSGAPGNNYINFYQVANGSKHEISNCVFAPTVDNNIVRISNRTSAEMELLVKDCEYNFVEGVPTEYTGFLLCQDYTNKSGIKQDFSKVNVIIDNVICDGERITVEGAKTGCIFYVYEDGAGIITGQNDPVVNIK